MNPHCSHPGVDLSPLFPDTKKRRDVDAVRTGLLINENFAARLGRFKVFLRKQKTTPAEAIFDVDVDADAGESFPVRNASLQKRLLAAAKALATAQRKSVDNDRLSPKTDVPNSACFCTACADRAKWNCALGTNPKRWPRNANDYLNWLQTCDHGPMVHFDATDAAGPRPTFPTGAPVRAFYFDLLPFRAKLKIWLRALNPFA